MLAGTSSGPGPSSAGSASKRWRRYAWSPRCRAWPADARNGRRLDAGSSVNQEISARDAHRDITSSIYLFRVFRCRVFGLRRPQRRLRWPWRQPSSCFTVEGIERVWASHGMHCTRPLSVAASFVASCRRPRCRACRNRARTGPGRGEPSVGRRRRGMLIALRARAWRSSSPIPGLLPKNRSSGVMVACARVCRRRGAHAGRVPVFPTLAILMGAVLALRH